MARDLGMPDEKVRVICQYMGGGFGNKNQNQDADLDHRDAGQGSRRAGQAGVLAQRGLHRRARPLADARSTTRSASRRDGTLQAIQLRGYSGMGPYRKNSGAIGGIEIYQCPNIETVVYPGLHEPDGLGKLPRPRIPAGLLRHPVDDGRRRGRS